MEPGGRNQWQSALFLAASQWAREQGFTRFHLGGGGGDDSLLQFKVRFGLVESAVGKEIHDEQAYRALGGQGCDGYFPAYRRTAWRSRPPACWLAARGGLRP